MNDKPLTGATHFVDASADLERANAYSVPTAGPDAAQVPAGAFHLPANAPPRPHLSLPVQQTAGYPPNDASVADLDGDGEYEIILQQTGRAKDNSQGGVTDPPILEAYNLDGTMLWRINLGKNIGDGAHYTQFMVYDLDGDGGLRPLASPDD